MLTCMFGVGNLLFKTFMNPFIYFYLLKKYLYNKCIIQHYDIASTFIYKP